MTASHPILEYSVDRVSRNLTLEVTADETAVIFPVAPRWWYLLQIYGTAAIGFIKLATGVAAATAFWLWTNAHHKGPVDVSLSMHHLIATIVSASAAAAMFWWTVSAYEWWRYQRWGRTPQILSATKDGLLLRRLGWTGMIERFWPADDVQAIELKRVLGNLSWKRAVVDLHLTRRNSNGLRFRLSTKDSQLPARIAQELANRLRIPF